MDKVLNEYKIMTSADGTIRHLKKIGEKWQLHNVDNFAYIPLGNRKKGEYFINGIKYTKDKFKAMKKDANGLPWFKNGTGNVRV
jgi:hypothetical protein